MHSHTAENQSNEIVKTLRKMNIGKKLFFVKVYNKYKPHDYVAVWLKGRRAF